MGKRIVNVLAAAAYFGVALSLSGKGGIALAAVGAFLYNDNSIERIRKSAVGKYLVGMQDEKSKVKACICKTSYELVLFRFRLILRCLMYVGRN